MKEASHMVLRVIFLIKFLPMKDLRHMAPEANWETKGSRGSNARKLIEELGTIEMEVEVDGDSSDTRNMSIWRKSGTELKKIAFEKRGENGKVDWEKVKKTLEEEIKKEEEERIRREKELEKEKEEERIRNAEERRKEEMKKLEERMKGMDKEVTELRKRIREMEKDLELGKRVERLERVIMAEELERMAMFKRARGNSWIERGSSSHVTGGARRLD